ncbi:MAG: DUF11 domain-containing protein, partial [Chitinophagales bacterium]|nr:DUF11 domain-containing protein [Chitinophagales bacterium]
MKKLVLTMTVWTLSVLSAWAQTDLALTKTVDNSSPSINTDVSFVLTLSNESSATAASNVTVTDLLPAGLSFVSANASQGTYDNATGIWSLQTSLAAGSSATLTIVATATAEGVTSNIAEVTAVDEGDTDSSPNNGIYSEDDYAIACVSVPVQMCEGQGLDLTATSSEIPAGATIYKWYKGSIDPANLIAGANSVILALTNLQLSDAGNYYFTAEDANGCIHESCCPVNVVVNPIPTPTATNDGANLCDGGTTPANFSTTGLVAGSYTYAWSGPGVANMSDPNSANPIIATPVLADAGVYTVTVTGAGGCSATSTTDLLVNELPVLGLSYDCGSNPAPGTATITATASVSTGTLEYSLDGGA